MPHKSIQLRPTTEVDLAHLFRFQLDEEAAYLAAFMPKDHTDQAAYLAKYRRFLLDPTIHMQSIVVDEELAGSIAKFEIEGDAEITYWLDRHFWGRGVATAALRSFLQLEPARPLFGRVAFDNFGSQKVLTNCGFRKVGTDKGFASARQVEIEEFIYQLL
ncbi:GNAT family N-acetyltransferase [Hymenobacter sediminicola]|uniref:GNAT family N-acetyltransferase n=1 Tax=Hymenobacter sediminicola TaxID=2761579 RepID=A0A7G7WBV1_9BACT|nr:GNAT family N-acetyltransferase [Hymenobacter sediminicola]QNH63844.1 GNAT family N-acetyltransferase [Hymenobacter sediminicola]